MQKYARENRKYANDILVVAEFLVGGLQTMAFLALVVATIFAESTGCCFGPPPRSLVPCPQLHNLSPVNPLRPGCGRSPPHSPRTLFVDPGSTATRPAGPNLVLAGLLNQGGIVPSFSNTSGFRAATHRPNPVNADRKVDLPRSW